VRRYREVQLDGAVAHVVAPRRGELTRSSAPLLLDDPVRAFLTEHVVRGIGDGNATAASFKVTGPDRAEGLCRAIIASNDGLVGNSAGLASLLYEASANEGSADTRVSDGTLVALRCTATAADSASVCFVALLKLDPNDAFSPDRS
jgi:hypothetical protein